MARIYPVSADMNEKEKVVGGVLTLVQTLWIGGGVAIFGSIYYLLSKVLPVPVAIIIAAMPTAVFIFLFAFYKKEDLPFATYLLYKRNMKKKTKTLVNDYTYDKDFSTSPEELGGPEKVYKNSKKSKKRRKK